MAASQPATGYVVSPIHSEPSSDDDERQVNGFKTIPSPPKKNGLVSHFTEEIRPTMFAEFQLLILTFCTGMQGM